MSKKTLRVALSAVVILGAFTLLMAQTVRESAQYYKHVDEVMASPEQWYGKRLQLHGFVVADSITARKSTLDWRFQVQNGGHVVPASYRGVVPDTFKDGSEVVLVGTLGPDGFHVAPDGVKAKCPSKYEPGSPAAAGYGR
jgi:cytochrome c-type biogenesis protein CcmE